jgi:hypothetical protein
MRDNAPQWSGQNRPYGPGLVVSPFLDRQHGTEPCVIEQIERFAPKDHWIIELYSQRVSQLSGVFSASGSSAKSLDSMRPESAENSIS